MKYISLLMLLICMSAFANAGNSVPVEKEKKVKSTKSSTRGVAPGAGRVSSMASPGLSRPSVNAARNAAAPITAVADVFNFAEGTPVLTGNVLVNDTRNAYPISRAVQDGVVSEAGTFNLNANGTFSYTPPNPQFSGTVTFSYHIEDDVEPNSAVVTVTLNINGPNDPPVITVPASFSTAENTQGTINGVSVADPDALSYNAIFVTFTPSDPAVTFSYTPTGTISINMDPDGITIALGGNINNLNAYLAGGNLKYNPPANSTASFNFTVRATDFTSTPSTVVPVNILDATPPPPPVTLIPANGSSINDNTPTFSGTAEANSNVTIFIDGSAVGATSADASGNWTFTYPVIVVDGPHTVHATAEDAAGNTSTAGNTNNFTIDTAPPSAPTTMLPANGSITNNPRPLIYGTTASGTTVTLVLDGINYGPLTPGGSGDWSFTPASDLAEGSHTAYATATDIAGNTSTAGNTNTFTVDITPPPPPVTVTPANGSITNDNTPEVTGTAEANSTITVTIDGTTAGTSPADASGNWTFTPGTALTPGNHTVNATASDGAGNTSVSSNTNTFTIDVAAPGVTITSAAPAIVNTTFTATIEFTEDVTGFVVSDITAGNATLSAFTAVDGNTYTVLVTPAADGAVTLDVAAAVAQDAGGNNNTAAAQFTRTYDASDPTVTITSAAAPIVTSPFTATITFSENVAGFVQGDITANNATLFAFTMVNGSTYTVLVAPIADGPVTLDVAAAVAQDAATNPNTAATQFTRTYDISAPTVTITSAAPTIVNAPFTATITFSEDVAGFVQGDIVTSNANLSAFTVVNNSTYTVLVTPVADGSVTLDVAAAVAQDAATYPNTAATQFTRTYDASQPGVTITSAAPAIVNNAFTATIEFTEDVTGFVIGDITAGNATLSAFTAVDGNTYTVLVTPAADGPVTLDVAAAVAQDAGGNGNTAAAQFTRTYDASQPGVTITSPAPAIVNAAFTATIEFSEDVTGFVVSDITVGNATLSAFTAVDGNTYTVLVTPAANGPVTLDVAAAVAQDAGGNGNTAAAQFSRTYDASQPGVTITSPAPTIVNAAFTATIEFTEDVTGFAIGDITAGNATLSAFTAVDGNTYTVLVTPAADGPVTLDVAAAVAQDAGGNNNTAATQFTRTYDASQPGVAITSPAPAIVNAAFTATIEFTEDVTGFVVGDITAGNATLSAFTAVDGNTYTVLVTPTADGPVTLDVAAAVAQDGAGNNNTAAAQFTRTYDASQPGVAITSPAPAIVNAAFTATIEFTEDVTGFVIGDITAGNATLSAFTAVDGNTYTVLVTPAADGPVTLDVAAAVAQDAGGNNNTAAAQFTRTYDASQPGVTITSPAPAIVNNAFTATIEFTEDVTGFVVGDITAGNATLSAFTAVDGNTYTVLVTPAADGAVTLDVAAAVAQDGAGNNNTAATQFTRTYDANQPGVTITSAAPAIVNAAFTATIEFTEDVTGFVVSDITPGNATLSAFTAVDGNTYTVLVTPTADGPVTLDVAAAVAQDGAGNNNTVATQFTRTYDASQPGVTITSPAPAIVNNAFTATIEFTEDVTGFVIGDITAGNATLSAFTAVDGNTYTVLVTPAADGAVTLDVAAAVAQDAGGNNNTAATQFTRTYDASQPGVTITSPAPAIVNNAFTATIEFTEDVTGFVIGDITAGNATLSAFTAVDGNTYTVLVTPAADGAVTLDVAAAVAQDAGGNNNTAATQFTRTYDASQPGVTITSPAPAIVNNAFTATIEFTEDVTGFVVGDITAGNATLSAFTAVDGNTYTVLVTPAANGAVTLDVAAAVAQDAGGNNNTAAAQFTRTYDATAPAVTVTIAAPVLPAAYIATFTFSEPVTGFSLAGINTTNATASNFIAVNATTYTAEITPSACTFTVTANAGSAADAAGNNNTVSNTLSTTQPTPVITITSNKPAKVVAGEAVILTAAGATTYQWTAAHGIVSGANTAQLHIAATQTTTYTVTGTNQWGCAGTATYQQEIDAAPAVPAIIVPANGSSTSNLRPAISGTADANTIITVYLNGTSQGTVTADASGNWSFTPAADLATGPYAATASAATPLGTSSAQSAAVNFTIDNGAPTVTITASVPDATTGVFTATFTFSEPVTGFIASDITANGGTIGAFTPVSTTVYTAEITPTACTVTLQAIAGIAADAAGNLNAASNTSSTTLPNPVVTITSNKPATVVAGETVILTASGAATYQWANAHGIVSGQNTAQLTIAATQTTTYSVTGTSQFGCTATATYQQMIDVAPAVPVITIPVNGTVTANLRPVISGTADANTTITVYLNGATQGTTTANGTGNWNFIPAADLAAGAYAATATASTPLGTASAQSAAVNFTIDVTPPTVTLTVSTPDAVTGVYTGTFTFSEPVTGFTATDINVNGGTASAFTAVSASVYTVSITPTACTSTLQTAAATAADAAGNANSASNIGSVTQPAPTVTITSNKPATVLAGETVILTASGAATYVWANAHGIVSGQNTAQLTIEPTQNTTYTVTGTSQFGCTANAQYSQQVDLTPPVPSTPVITAPVSGAVTNNARPAISGTSQPNVTITVYLNNTVNGTTTADASGAWSFTPSADLADGAYAATATATNALNNTSPQSAAVNFSIERVRPAVTATATVPNAATGIFQVTFTFSEPVTGFTEADITHPRSTINSFTAVSTTVYTISVTPQECAANFTVNADVATDAAGNGNTASNALQVQQANPVINITADKPNPVSLGDNVVLTATGGTNYIWEPAPSIVSGMNTPQLTVRPTADYVYRVAGYNQWGCMTQATINVTTTADYKVDATNVITPNGDGINDRWVIRNITSYPDNFLRIFDRAGQLVYQKRNYANEWNGTTASGQPLAEGAYFFVMEIDNGKKTVKGYITLIREK